jgi:glycosyltransferase involved in cell wall biosynthesis
MKQTYRVAVDATCWQNNRGYGRHARALLRHLLQLDESNHYTFILDSQENLESIPENAELRIVNSSQPTNVAAAADGHRSLVDMWRMGNALSDRKFDILLFPTLYSFVPVVSRAKKLVVIHDVIPEKFPELTFPKPMPRLFWKLKSALGRRQADAIITVSEYSRRWLIHYFGIPEERTCVVGEASDDIFRVLEDPSITPEVSPKLHQLDISPAYRIIVYVGGFGPHKNLETLVEALARLLSRPGFEDVRLVLVGEYQREVFHSTVGSLREKIAALGISEQIIFTGYLPDEELVVLLNVATVLTLPSRMEGFGLPAIEAAACGCPVVATKESPLPELLGQGGVYFDPSYQEELERALERILTSPDLRQKMRISGLAAAHALTWDAAASQLRDTLLRVAQS